MAAEPQTELAPTGGPTVAAIDNEFPAYRALSASAIVAMVLGVASILCFADLWFLVAAVAAVLVGVLADRKIRRMPQFLTGRKFAQAGIALGTIFGLASVSMAGVQVIVQNIQAGRYVKQVQKILEKKSLGEMVLQQYPPEERGKLTVAQALESFTSSGPAGMDNPMSPLAMMMKRLNSSPEQKCHFVKMESVAQDGLDVAAAALFDLDGPVSAENPKAEEFALVIMKAKVAGGRYAWRIQDIAYPYQPNSFKPTPTKVDDGHGHAH